MPVTYICFASEANMWASLRKPQSEQASQTSGSRIGPPENPKAKSLRRDSLANVVVSRRTPFSSTSPSPSVRFSGSRSPASVAMDAFFTRVLFRE